MRGEMFNAEAEGFLSEGASIIINPKRSTNLRLRRFFVQPACPRTQMSAPATMDDWYALYQYIAPLSQKWSAAVNKFLDPDTLDRIPPKHPARALLMAAREQLRDGTMIDDRVMWAYATQLLKLSINPPAYYMDPMAWQSLRSSIKKRQPAPQFARTLPSNIERGVSAHVFWPIHHDKVLHWSLVHIDIDRKIITSYDSLRILGDEQTTQAMNDIYAYWLSYRVQKDEQMEWKLVASSWDSHARVQAEESNDCGILAMLLMRRLRAFDAQPPQLPTDQTRKEFVMCLVGRRMRQRIVAELVAGQLDPADALVPTWLQDE
jgi:hypothetical protein